VSVDPFDADHLFIGISTGGVFESRDAGATWSPLNRGVAADFLPDPDAAYGHDPHCPRVHLDGGTVWPRTAIGGKPAVYESRDAGESWQRLDRGLPREQAWLTVKRQAMTSDTLDPVGLYFGTTSGEVWGSFGETALVP
jgi:hypothetical protein